jgi:GxxExxY protein
MNTDKNRQRENGTDSGEPYPEQDLTEKILRAAFAVHNTLGAGFLERVYSNALAVELRAQGIALQNEVPLKILYRNTIVGDYIADLVVDGRVLVELKACASLDPVHTAQLLNYLRASKIHVGLLLNFGRPKLEYRRFVS